MIESIIDKVNQVIKVCFYTLMRLEARGTNYVHDLHCRIKHRFRSYQSQVPDLVLELDDLGFVRGTLIFQTWKFGNLSRYKDVPP